MSLTTESLIPILQQLKKEIKADIEEVVKKEISSLNLSALIEEQNLKIESLTKDNYALKETINRQSALLENFKRQRNVVLYGVEEAVGENHDSLWNKIIKLFREDMELEIKDTDLDFITRIGSKAGKTRAVLVGFVSKWKKNKVLRNSYKLKGTSVFVVQDCDKNTRIRRKELVDLKRKLVLAGRTVAFRRNGLVVDGAFKDYQLLKRENDAVQEEEEESNVKKRKRVKKAELHKQSCGVADFFRPRTGSGASTKSVEH